MSQKLRRLTAAGSVLVATAVALPAMATAAAPLSGSARTAPRPFFDAREAAVDRASAPNATPPRRLASEDRAARERLVRGLGRQAVLDADPVTATPRVLGRLDGALTGARAGDPADIALDYVREHAGALGLEATDLSTLELADRTTTEGVTHLRWKQEYRGVPAFDNELRVNVDADGRVVNVLGAPRHALSVPSTTPALSATDARGALARNVGTTDGATVTSGPTGVRHETRFSSGDRARLVLFGDVRAVRLAWHLTLAGASDAVYDAVVDADTGAVLRRVNLVKAIDASVFRNYPGATNGGTQVTENLDPYLTSTTALSGPFAHAWSDINDRSASATAEAPNAGEEVVPQQYLFTPFTGATCNNAHLCSWNHNVASSWQTNRRQNAVQAFWYVNHFHDHLEAPPIGFTPEQGNFAVADPVDVETDDGANGPNGNGLPDDAHIDNANMLTLPDGQSPVMQMYLFENTPASPFREVNGGDDASVVYHEYTHGLSSRLITDADGVEAVNSAQSGAMGEAWSDWYAKDLLNNEGLQPDTAAPGEVDMGAYVDATPNQIRTQPLDCPVGAPATACPGTPTAGHAGGYTYGDFGHVSDRGPEVHSDGEIWGETLWDLRTALADSDLSEELVTEAMRLSPPEPTFLDERNAIIQADQTLHGGTHVAAIWDVFAARGMGFFAGTTDGNDVAPVESFALPPAAGGPTGTITGRATDSVTGAPMAGIVVGVGGLDTPPSSFTAVTDASGAYTIGGVPAGTYPKLTFRPPTGYERFTSAVTVPAGDSVTVDAPLRRDWATVTAGASVTANDTTGTSSGCPPSGAFDLSQATGWGAFNAEAPGAAGNPHPGSPPSAVVRLPVTVNVTAFAVDPAATCGDDATAATGTLRIEVSADNVTFTPVLTHTFGAADNGQLTTLALPTAANGVRFVRITMLTNQLPAAGAPANAAGRAFTDLTEFEVFGAPSPAPATPPATGGGTPPAAGTSPAPQPAPQPGGGTAPTQAQSRPTGAIAASRTRGRATFTVGCSLACRATATMTVSRATATRLRLRSTRLARVTRGLTTAGRRSFALAVSATTLRRIRARGVRTVSATVTVAIRDSRGQTRTVRRAVRIRIR